MSDALAPTRATILDWVNNSKHGPLLGNIDISIIYGPGAFMEVYWIDDDEYVGTLYPDKSRMVSSIAQRMEKDIQDRFERCVRSKAATEIEGESLKLKFKENSEKPRLKFKSKTILKPIGSNERTLWYHTESESYTETHSEKEAEKMQKRFLKDIREFLHN